MTVTQGLLADAKKDGQGPQGPAGEWLADTDTDPHFLCYAPGKRPLQATTAACLRTAFWWPLHNESLNIWTSVLAWPMHAAVLAEAMAAMGANASGWTLWPFALQFCCCSLGWVAVAMYHVMLCHRDSALVSFWRRADFAGVFLQGYGLGTCVLFMVGSCWPPWSLAALHSVATLCVVGAVRQTLGEASVFHMRLLFMSGSAGVYFAACGVGVYLGAEPRVASDLLAALLCIGLGLALFIFHLPERIWPFSFWSNCLLQSHVLWHCAVLGFNFFLARAGLDLLHFRAAHAC